ncbi:MAG: serine/threonine-protein kinase, partial [Blastocatellia bacterium]|nr:serine/threonine-protein kinase [Blastocatellia bacterium]
MPEPHLCPRCGVESPLDAPEGLCPNCLLQLALDSTSSGLRSFANDTDGQDSEAEIAGPTPGTRVRYFGDYELLEEIARGGMGIVYRAKQLSLNRIVAVKMMRPGELASEVEIRRFLTEAEAAANLQHPNIVAIHEVGEHEGLHYFSMDFVEGKNLAELIAGRPLSSHKAASYLKTIAEAVAFAHGQGTLHRDLKPANILIDASDQPRITDFGLAKSIESDSGLTDTGAVIGTPNYMPPEQAGDKRGKPGKTSDVYSLGAILYEMLTGRPPFQGETPVDTVMMVLNSEPVSPRLLNPKLDRDLETICMKCLEKEPGSRYSSAQELADDLDRFLDHRTIKARPVRIPVRAWRWLRRNPWPSAAALAVVLVLVASVATLMLRERTWQSLRERARSERLAGRRSEAMKLIAEAARIKSSPELREEAIHTITTPGVRLLHEIPFGSGLHGLRFSPDSKMLAIAGRYNLEGTDDSWDETIKAWEMYSGRPLAQTYYQKMETAFAFSPNDSTLALLRETYNISPHSASITEQTLILWDPVTGREIARIKRPFLGGANNFLTFNPEGDHVIKTDGGCTVWMVNVADRSESTFCIGGEMIAFLPDLELLLKHEDRLQYFSLRTLQRKFSSPEGMAVLSVSADGRVAVLRPNRPGQKNDSLVVWNLRENRQIGQLPVTDAAEAATLVSADGRLIALREASEPGIIQLWEIRAAGLDNRLMVAGANTKILFDRTAAFSPDGYLFAAFVAEGASGSLRIWSTQTGKEVAVLPPGIEETRLEWTTETGKEVTILPGSDNYSIFQSGHFIRPVWSSDSRLLATRAARTITIRDDEGGGSSSPYYVANVWEVVPPTPAYRSLQGINSINFFSDGKEVFTNGSAWEVVNSP